ncbi:MAG: type II toxin-antitoxin system HicB family antitoxin [Deltaproteobacteria bacterium]|nr:type II toxin-antitoxin system HicB family antitoxin [Deltaproteobacteria bacterium]
MAVYPIALIKCNSYGNYSAYSPDLPGYAVIGATREEAEQNIHEAIELHLQGLKEDGLSIPQSTSFAEHVAIR